VLARFTLSHRILLTGVVIAIGFAVPLLLWLIPHQRVEAYEMKTGSTQYVVDMAWGVLDYYAKQAAGGKMSVAEAQELAKTTLRGERFQGGNYVWINDTHPSMIMHPMNPALEGKDLTGSRDPKGVAIFVEMVQVCSAHGEGAVRYMWPKPGASVPLPKISYVKLHPAWGWIVGAGIYVDDVEAALHKSRNVVFLIAGLDLLISAALSFFMARSLSAPVRRAVANLTQFTTQSAVAVNHLSSASQSIASGMSQQAASLEETGGVLNELTAHNKRNFAGAQNMQNLAAQVKAVVADGNKHMDEMNGAIRQIGDAAQQVRRIVKTIEEIAFQTNILALNAAVEAARAGEAGAGFSVVADEVRSLAQRASQAARETADLIGNSLSSSEQGAVTSAKLAAAFSDIVSRIAEVSGGLGEITSSFQAESEGIAQINAAVNQISTVTQAQASTSEETASAAEQLRAQSESVRELTHELQTLVEGASAQRDL